MKDTDGDGFGDNGDEFPLDVTQNNDTDNDGYGTINEILETNAHLG